MTVPCLDNVKVDVGRRGTAAGQESIALVLALFKRKAQGVRLSPVVLPAVYTEI